MPERSDSAVVLVSGGVNGAVAAAQTARDRRANLLFVDHGQKAAEPERSAIQAIARKMDAERTLVIDVPHVAQIETSPRQADGSGGATPSDQAARAGLPSAPMPAMLHAAVEWAVRIGAKAVVTGVSQLCDEGDREAGPGEGAPDHRHEFYHAFNIMLETLRPPRLPIQVEVPYIDLSRGDIVKLGLRFGAPFEATWSCHLGGDAPCGHCVGCRSRAAAFLAAGERDPASPIRT